MAGMKKYMILGMAAVILFSAVILFFGMFTEKPQTIRNETNNIGHIIPPESDEVLDSFYKYNDPKYPDSILYLQIAEEGSDDIDFSINSVAVHNTFFDAWYVFNKNRNIDLTDELFIKGAVADAGVIYNEIYIYIPEVTVNGTKAEMPVKKLFVPAEFVTMLYEENAFIKLTFLKDKSVFEDNGTYVFAPQIHVETYKDAELNITNSSVEVVNGTVWMDIVSGMNNDGEFLAGAKYNPNIE